MIKIKQRLIKPINSLLDGLMVNGSINQKSGIITNDFKDIIGRELLV